MTTFHVKHPKMLGPLLRKHMQQRERRIKDAVKKTCRQGAAHVRRNVPVAFSELRDSVEALPDSIMADAPHAAPVEEGSRPHTPPLNPLIRWVKLRHLQGATMARRPRAGPHLPGNTTQASARAVYSQLSRNWRRSDVESNYRRLAFQIQQKIAKAGTRPHWYMRNSVPVIEEYLDKNIRSALPDSGT